MLQDAFQNWRRERDAIEKEMDSLITAGLPQSSEDRRVRQLQYMALIERREAAARNFLRSDAAIRREKSLSKKDRRDRVCGPVKRREEAARLIGLQIHVSGGHRRRDAFETVAQQRVAALAVAAVAADPLFDTRRCSTRLVGSDVG